MPYPDFIQPQDNLDRLIMNRRMVFIPAEAPNITTYSEKTNLNEARIVTALLEHIYRITSKEFDPNKTVGVIVPYRNQIAMIRKEIEGLHIPVLRQISIDTVERYQGSQRDVIIYSFTVRNFSQLNFLTANTFREGDFCIDRKLNVAITRARKQLFLTGNPQILGANITFYKLMEFIRMHNGYIETTVDRFCKGEFNIPEYNTNWDLQTENYELPEHFNRMFGLLVEQPFQKLKERLQLNDTYIREITAYGRYDLKSYTEDGKQTGSMTITDRNGIYAYLYMRRQYSAARALFETTGNWLNSSIHNVSGRIVFCDLSYENGASGLAFTDICKRMSHLDLVYLGIYSTKEMKQMSEAFFNTEEYKCTTCIYSSRG